MPCSPTAASTPVLVASTASRFWDLAVACLTGKNCPGPAADCNGVAKSPVGGALVAVLCRIWPASAAPAMPLNCSSLTCDPRTLFSPCLQSGSARSCRSGGIAGHPFVALGGSIHPSRGRPGAVRSRSCRRPRTLPGSWGPPGCSRQSNAGHHRRDPASSGRYRCCEGWGAGRQWSTPRRRRWGR